MRHLLAAALAVMLALPVAAQDYNKGLEAAQRSDYATALREWRPLALQGDVRAQYNLGQIYIEGLGVPRDYGEAAKWYRKASEQGDARARYNLGLMYANGHGVPQDSAEAVKWFRLAAAQGLTAALRNLGVMYKDGLGIPQDLVRAHMWLALAAEQGSETAVKALEDLAPNMTSEQIAKAVAHEARRKVEKRERDEAAARQRRQTSPQNAQLSWAAPGPIVATRDLSRFSSALPRIRWKMQSTFGSKLPIIGTSARRLTVELDRLSNGRVKLKFFEPGSLVSPLEAFNAVGGGDLDAAFSSAGYQTGRIRAATVAASVPFGPPADRYWEWATQGGGYEALNQIYAEYNVYGVPCAVTSADGAGWFRQPIRNPSDLRGIRMRIFGLGAVVLSKLGVNIQVLAGADIYPALERGTIDATEFSMPAIDIDLGLHRISKNYYYPSWHQTAGLLELLLNRKEWNQLSFDTQEFIRGSCEENAAHTIQESNRLNQIALRDLRYEGVKISPVPQSIITAARSAWLDVLADELARDSDFRRMYQSLKPYLTE